jgi:hypothetical protein
MRFYAECTVCKHEALDRIDQKLLERTPFVVLGKRYGLTTTDLQRHEGVCVRNTFVDAKDDKFFMRYAG